MKLEYDLMRLKNVVDVVFKRNVMVYMNMNLILIVMELKYIFKNFDDEECICYYL